MPYIARDVFMLDQRGLGWLVASFAGGLAASVAMGAVGGRLRPGRTMLLACVAWYLCLFGFAATRQPALAMVLLAAAGACQSTSMLALSMLLLRSSDQRFRRRISGRAHAGHLPAAAGPAAGRGADPVWVMAGRPA